jgi:hypothetical protein
MITLYGDVIVLAPRRQINTGVMSVADDVGKDDLAKGSKVVNLLRR